MCESFHCIICGDEIVSRFCFRFFIITGVLAFEAFSGFLAGCSVGRWGWMDGHSDTVWIGFSVEQGVITRTLDNE